MISKEFHQRFCSNRVWVWFPKKDGANSRLWRVTVGLVHRGAAMDGPLRRTMAAVFWSNWSTDDGLRVNIGILQTSKNYPKHYK